jgi:hypothetical protein
MVAVKVSLNRPVIAGFDMTADLACGYDMSFDRRSDGAIRFRSLRPTASVNQNTLNSRTPRHA